MLVLSRKAGQKLTIGKDIVVKIVKVDGNRVRIGIEAPAETKVLRTEIVRAA